MTKTKLLLIDDDESILALIKTKFKSRVNSGEFDLTVARDAKEGLKILESKKIDIALIDLHMPKIDGFELIDQIHKERIKVKTIIISADNKLNQIRMAMNHDAFDFIIKPINFEDLELTINKALEHINMENLTEEKLEQSYEKLRDTLYQVIESISSIEELRDPYTAGHMKRVAQLSKAIAVELGFTQDQITGIYVAGMLHDIGKICIPSEILSKPGGLREREFSLIKDHSKAGYEILKKIEFPWPIAKIVLQHHEKLDGSGYPQGLSEDQILIESKIIAVADVIEAVSSYRPYRPALGIDKALKIISKNKGVLFDSKVVEVTLKLFLEKDFEFKNDQQFSEEKNKIFGT